MAAAKPKTKPSAEPMPATENAPNDRRTQTDEGRRLDDRPDRRAFWRPTPDRRREATEQGRRTDDAE